MTPEDRMVAPLPAPACASCGHHWEKGDVATSTQGGPWKHNDCTDPKLSKPSNTD